MASNPKVKGYHSQINSSQVTHILLKSKNSPKVQLKIKNDWENIIQSKFYNAEIIYSFSYVKRLPQQKTLQSFTSMRYIKVLPEENDFIFMAIFVVYLNKEFARTIISALYWKTWQPFWNIYRTRAIISTVLKISMFLK